MSARLDQLINAHKGEVVAIPWVTGSGATFYEVVDDDHHGDRGLPAAYHDIPLRRVVGDAEAGAVTETQPDIVKGDKMVIRFVCGES